MIINPLLQQLCIHVPIRFSIMHMSRTPSGCVAGRADNTQHWNSPDAMIVCLLAQLHLGRLWCFCSVEVTGWDVMEAVLAIRARSTFKENTPQPEKRQVQL